MRDDDDDGKSSSIQLSTKLIVRMCADLPIDGHEGTRDAGDDDLVVGGDVCFRLSLRVCVCVFDHRSSPFDIKVLWSPPPPPPPGRPMIVCLSLAYIIVLLDKTRCVCVHVCGIYRKDVHVLEERRNQE